MIPVGFSQLSIFCEYSVKHTMHLSKNTVMHLSQHNQQHRNASRQQFYRKESEGENDSLIRKIHVQRHPYSSCKELSQFHRNTSETTSLQPGHCVLMVLCEEPWGKMTTLGDSARLTVVFRSDLLL